MKYHYLNVLLLISFRPFGHLVPHIVHIIGVYCILLIEECTTYISTIHYLYWSTQFFFSSFYFSVAAISISGHYVLSFI